MDKEVSLTETLALESGTCLEWKSTSFPQSSPWLVPGLLQVTLVGQPHKGQPALACADHITFQVEV